MPAPTSRAATTPSTRSSRSTSHIELEPDQAAAADRHDDRRRAERGGRQLGAGTRAAGRTRTATSARRAGRTARAGTCTDPNSSPNPAYPVLPEQGVPVPPPAVQLLRGYAPGTPGRDAPAGRGRVPEPRGGHRTRRASSTRSASSSRSGSRTSTRATRARRRGSDHLVQLLQAIQNSSVRKDTMVVVTYDEFGGQWDHVSPPGQGGAPGPHDKWGPGTRIPALVIAPQPAGRRSSSTTRSTTRRRSSPRSSTAGGCSRSARATRRSTTCRASSMPREAEAIRAATAERNTR